MAKPSVWSKFLEKISDREINRDVSYIHGVKPSISKHVLETHFTYDLDTNILTMTRDMSRFDIFPKKVPEAFMDHLFNFVDDNGKVIQTNYYTIRYNLYNHATSSDRQRASKSYKKKVFSSCIIPGSPFGFSF